MGDGKRNVLVVDDDEDNISLMRAALKKAFAEVNVLSAGSGHEALTLAASTDLDAILLDIVMPGLDGFDVCRELKSDERLAAIPVIFLTAIKTDRASRLKALEVGGDGFLSKPVDEVLLTAQLRAMFKVKDAHVAARQKAEADLRGCAERFRAAQDISPDGFTILHPLKNDKNEIVDFTWIHENRAIARINGTDPEKVIGKRLLGLFPSHAGTPVFKAFVSVAATGSPQVLEDVYAGDILSKPIWLRLSIAAIGEDIAVWAHDVTETKLSGDLIRQNEEKYRNLISKMRSGFGLHEMIFDDKGEPADYRFLEVNPAWEKMVGIKAETVVGRTIREIMPDIEDTWIKLYGRVAKTGVPEEFEDYNAATRKYYRVSAYRPSEGRFAAVFDDVTERRSVEARLRMSEEKYRLLVETTDTGFLILDGQGRVQDANMEYVRLTGRRAFQEIVGRPVTEWTAPYDMRKNAEAVEKCVRTGSVRGLVVDYASPDGAITPVEINATVHGEGGTLRIVSLCRDVSERVKTAESVRKQAMQLERIASQTPGMLYQFERSADGAYRVPYASRQINDIFGCAPEDVRRSFEPISKVIHPDDLDRLVASIETSAKTLTPWKCEYRVRLPGRGTIWLSGSSVPERMPDGSVLWSGYNVDVTEEKRTAAALAYQNILLKVQQEASIDGILVVGEEGEVKSFNRTFLGMWNIPQEIADSGRDDKLLNHVLGSLIDPEGFLAKVRELYSDKTAKNRDEIRLRDGRIFDRYSSPLRDADGKYFGRIWSFRDVTENRRTEAERLKSQKLESLGTFAGGIAHDFNNMLTAIQGNISLLKGHLDGDAEGQDILHEAETASRSAKGLARQLLTFAAGGTPVIACVDVRALAHDAALFAARGTKAKCVLEDGSEPLYAKVDRDQIVQVIHNLVLNAAHAMPMGGCIYIRHSAVEVAAGTVPGLKAGNYVRVTVRDEGVGIPKDHLPRIFDPYFTTKTTGHGLGLAVCHSIMNKHGGAISAESEPGAGSTFTLYLPSFAGRPPESVTTMPAGIDLSGRRFLIMDDEEYVFKVLARMLAAYGASAERCVDGEEGLAAWRRARETGRPFDLVFADLTIPGGMGGVEMAKKMKEEDPRVKVLVSSGYSSDDAIADFESHGFAGVLPKPYTLEDVLDVLRKTLKK